MFDSLKKIYTLFEFRDKIKFLIIFVLMIVASLFELLGISLIPAFVIAVAEPEKIFELKYVGDFLKTLGITTSEQLAFSGAAILIVIYIAKNAFLTFYHYTKQKFVHGRKVYLQNRMFKAYMTAPYSFYIEKNSAELLRNVNSEVSKIINGTIMPFLEITLNTLMFLFIISTLLYFEPFITIITIVMMGGGGYLFLSITQKKTIDSGKISRGASGDMNRVVLGGLAGFKDARVLNREAMFLKKYNMFAEQGMSASVYQAVIKTLPKPIIETLLVSGILTVTLIMVYEGRSFNEIIPILTLFGVAAVKLMPVFNTLVQNITSIRYSAYSVYAIYDDLQILEKKYGDQRKQILRKTKIMPLNESIELQEISFRYNESDDHAVRDISLSIPKGSAVAFVGESGAGKTTLVDLILGLLEPTNGVIKADGVDVRSNIRGWMKNIGYIQQSNFIYDEKLFRNIAFGIPDDEIDKDKLDQAIHAAQLDSVVKKLPYGLNTRLGERGVRLSGGQRQRVTIARAMYDNPQVLIMDEATSALDNITEKFVIEAIERLRGDRTIIMIAHRLTTVKNCDLIYLMKDGQIVEQGTYNELLERSEDFRKMTLE